MRTLRLSLVGTVILTMVAGLGGEVAAQDATDQAVEPESILFVGNSYTYFNDGVENHVAALAASEDPPRVVEVDDSTIGAATLRVHHQMSAGDAAFGAISRIREGHDIVVLQDGIPDYVEHDVAPFLEYARLFDQEIKEAGAETVFFMTWPSVPFDWIGLDGIVAAHRQVEAELGAKVAPVGVAVANALTERPDLALLLPDGHETMAGTYLAAATIYATLFDQSPEGLPYHPDELTEDDAAFLQRVAWETVQQWRDGMEVPAPLGAAWVTGTETCSYDSAAGVTTRTTYAEGIWRIRDLPLSCAQQASDPRVSGTTKEAWNCDCQYGIGSPIFGTYELTGPDGSWLGTWRGTRSLDGTGHVSIEAQGTDAYEGLTYVVDNTYDATSTTTEGVIVRSGLPPAPSPSLSPAE